MNADKQREMVYPAQSKRAARKRGCQYRWISTLIVALALVAALSVPAHAHVSVFVGLGAPVYPYPYYSYPYYSYPYVAAYPNYWPAPPYVGVAVAPPPVVVRGHWRWGRSAWGHPVRGWAAPHRW